MEEERLENTEIEQSEGYKPRPAYQIWAAWFGVIIVVLGFILYLYRIATGGM